MHNVPYIPAAHKAGLIDVVEALVNNPVTYEAVMPFFLNGGKCGHKVMDVKGAVDVLREADTDGLLNKFKFKDKDGSIKVVNDFRIGNVLKNVIRRRAKLGPNWKIVDVSDAVAEANPEAAKQFREFLIVIGYKPSVE